MAESAAFCVQHRLEAPLDALCGRAAIGLSQGFVQTFEALQVAEFALKMRAGDTANQSRCYMELQTNNLFFTLFKIAAQVPVNLGLSNLKTLVVVLRQWAVLKRDQCEHFDPRTAFSGVAVAAVPLLGRPSATENEAVGLAHALASGLQQFPPVADSVEGRAVEEVLRVALPMVRKRIHRISTEQVADLAGAAASAWISTSETFREDVLNKCLVDVGQAVRFRRSTFQVSELVAIVEAFGKTSLKADVLADVLLQRLLQDAPSFETKDLITLLGTCPSGCWAGHPLSEGVLKEMKTRGLSTFSPPDLCVVAQSMAYLKDHGILVNEASEVLDMVAHKGQDAQLTQLALTQKIQLLQDLVVAETPNSHVCGLLVQEIWSDPWVALQGNLGVGLLRAVATLWPHLPASDGNGTNLLSRVSKLAPWTTARPDEVISMVSALSPLPMLLDHGSQDSLSQALLRVSPKAASVDELTHILVFLWKCACLDATRPAASTLKPFAAAAKKRLICGADVSAALSLQALAEALVKTGALQAPHIHGHCHEGCCHGHLKPDEEHMEAMITPGKCQMQAGCNDSCGYSHDLVTESESEQDSSEVRRKGHGTRGRQFKLEHARARHGSPCRDEGCCPLEVDETDGLQMQLNRHCTFSGHCVQIKNTFIHMACDASDSDNDCIVCRRLRSKSCDSKFSVTRSKNRERSGMAGA
jgi:hypothetical protein